MNLDRSDAKLIAAILTARDLYIGYKNHEHELELSDTSDVISNYKMNLEFVIKSIQSQQEQ